MLISSVRNFFKLCRYHKSFAILSVLSLAIAILSFLVLAEKGLYTYQYDAAQEYLFLESEVPEEIISIYGDVVNNKLLPEIDSISMIDDQYTGINYDASQFRMFLPYGRLFSQEELKQGANVALLSIEYIRNLPQEKIDSIWEDGISIDESHFAAIGGYTDIVRYFSTSELAMDNPMPTLVVIPAKSYLKLERKPLMLNCHFASALSNKQIDELKKLISAYESVDHYYIPGTGSVGIKAFIETLSVYLAVLLMSLIAVALIIVYWFRSDRERYWVYLVCGAQKRHIVFCLTINMLLLSVISYLVAWVGLEFINIWFVGVILTPLPAIWHVCTSLGIFTFCWLTVMLRSLPLLNNCRNISMPEEA